MKENLTAVYCRLSKEDLDKDMGKTLSESIKNQKSMLEAYALERQWNIYDFYIDEDYSGSDRNRPEFNRLIADSLLGRFNIVLCKNRLALPAISSMWKSISMDLHRTADPVRGRA
jgi:DNA invertase Pin-like site-specific DNA recombinase